MLTLSHAAKDELERLARANNYEAITNPFLARPNTFAGMPVTASNLFPIPQDCKACQGKGYPVGESYCATCKGTSGDTIIDTLQERTSLISMFPGPYKAPKITIITEPRKKRFHPRFPPAIAVDLPPLSRGLP